MDRYHFECIRKAEDAEAECLVMNNQEVRTKKRKKNVKFLKIRQTTFTTKSTLQLRTNFIYDCSHRVIMNFLPHKFFSSNQTFLVFCNCIMSYEFRSEKIVPKEAFVTSNTK